MVDILMATYNGEKYVREQIESILAQQFTNWMLYIRDDGSNDNTLEIVNYYAHKYSKKIKVIEDNKKGLGAKLNFAELMKYSQQNYCMFCDQDDIWLPNKIDITINEMNRMEKEFSQETPILIHTDLKVVNSKLNIINDSFWEYVNIDVNQNKLNNLLIKNTVTGCTVMINKSLKNIAQDIPKDCLMHDWWLALIATTFGKIGIIKKSTILYRQHENNELGAKAYSIYDKIKIKLKKPKDLLNTFNNEIQQAKAFYNLYITRLGENYKEKDILESFIALKDSSFVLKRVIIIKNKFLVNDLLKNIKTLIFI